MLATGAEPRLGDRGRAYVGLHRGERRAEVGRAPVDRLGAAHPPVRADELAHREARAGMAVAGDLGRHRDGVGEHRVRAALGRGVAAHRGEDPPGRHLDARRGELRRADVDADRDAHGV